jgi:hypothetical protein
MHCSSAQLLRNAKSKTIAFLPAIKRSPGPGIDTGRP